MVISVIESYRSDCIILRNILQNKLNLTVSDLLLLRYSRNVGLWGYWRWRVR